MMPTAAAPLFDDYLYARISEDDAGIEKNVTRQLRNARARSSVSNGRIIDEFSDNDISALKGAHRPGFEKLMAAVTAANPHRRQRRIICQHTSRLWRNRSERAHGIDTLGRAKIIVLPIDGPQLDLTTAAGRMVAGMLGEVDTGESETKGERIKDAALERAQEGRASGWVAYGWQRVYQYDSRGKVVGFDDVVNPSEADVVREIVKRLLAAESLAAITADLNEREIPAPRAGDRRRVRAYDQDERGSRWGKTSVKKIAVRPANIGFRVHHRGRDDEELMPAAWPPLISPGDHDAVVALTSDPARGSVKPGARVHLLTWGIGHCGICEGFLRVAKKGNRNYSPSYLYECDAKSCVGRNETYVDTYVGDVMVELLSRPDAADLLSGPAPTSQIDAMREARNLKGRLDQAAADYASGLIEAGQLRLITATLKPQIADLEAAAKAARMNPHTALAASGIGEQAEQVWAGWSVTQRRAVMGVFDAQVFIDKARRGPGFDPSKVRVRHRGSDD